MTNFLANIPALCCAGLAAFLIWHGKPNWGWFIFLAIILACAPAARR